MTTPPNAGFGDRPESSSTRDTAASGGGGAPTRRSFLRSFGTGAIALGASAAATGAAAQSTDSSTGPEIEAIDDWERSVTEIPAGEVNDGPAVSYEDGTVVVTGSTTVPNGCRSLRPARIAYSEHTSRLGVIVETYRTAEPDVPCTQAAVSMAYELRVQPAGEVTETVVDEAFSDAGRSVHPRDGERGIGDLPPAVADYEFQWGSDLEEGASIGPSEAAETEPTVTFDGSDVVVEGAVVYGSSSCNEVALRSIEPTASVSGHVGVEVVGRRKPTTMPRDLCTADIAAARYRLQLIGSTEDSIDRLRVEEVGRDGESSVAVVDREEGADLPPGVANTDLATEPDVSESRVEADPTIQSDASGDAPAVVVTGGVKVGPCERLAITDVRWVDDARTHLALAVDAHSPEREPGEICGPEVEPVATGYTATVVVDSLPERVTAEEELDADGEPVRSTTASLDADADLPPGVSSFDLWVHGPEGEEYYPDTPEVAVQTVSEGVQVTFRRGQPVGPCERQGTAGLRWADDARTHLVATLDVVADDDALQDGTCPEDSGTELQGYEGDLVLESRPDVLTVEELQGESEPALSETVDLSNCSSATTVDGQTVCKPESDDPYLDVNADGTVSHADVQAFFDVQHRPAWKRPDYFDFNGNEVVGHGDVVDLFERVARRSL